MNSFRPFRGTLYDPERVEVDAVVAPPYDVIGEAERAGLEGRSPYNAVRVELARDEPGRDRHAAATCHLRDWLGEGVLRTDPDPAFYLYRMGWHEADGRPRQTTGVVGALAVGADDGDVLAHERTMPKPLGDRLDLLRSCRANLSPIWCLSPVEGLTALLATEGPPTARCTDNEGVHHRLWRITSPAVIETISTAVGSQPLVIADGHHRYQTAKAYRDEHPHDPAAASVMALIVELDEEQLGVHPIHRVVPALGDGVDVPEVLGKQFEVIDAGPLNPDDVGGLLQRMAAADAFAFLAGSHSWLLRPLDRSRPESPELADPDSERVVDALELLGNPDLDYHHSARQVAADVEAGRAAAGFLLRPATVDQIAAVARAHDRMPEKTTFFSPKPRTGMVFRLLDEA